VTGERGPSIWLAGEALVAQMPELLPPRGPCRLHLPGERLAGTLLARRRADHDPPLSCRGLRGWRPEEFPILLPGVVGDRECGPRLRGGVGHAADPAYPRRAETGAVGGAIEPTVRHKDRRFRVLSAQLFGQRLHYGDQAELIAGVAVQRLAEQGYITLPGRRQRVASASIHCLRSSR
jgi:hypothetical protein